MKLELSLDQKDHYLNKCNIIFEDSETNVDNYDSKTRYVLSLEVMRYEPAKHLIQGRDFANYGDFHLINDFSNIPKDIKEVIVSMLQEKIKEVNG